MIDSEVHTYLVAHGLEHIKRVKLLLGSSVQSHRHIGKENLHAANASSIVTKHGKNSHVPRLTSHENHTASVCTCKHR